MRIAGIKENDIVDGEGICVSVWFQGCPHKCKGCHNPETWNFDGGYEIDKQELIDTTLNLINKNNINRNLSLLGGEPLCEGNIEVSLELASAAKQKYSSITIYCWTGYTLEEIIKKYGKNILKDIDILIDGEFELEKRDITLYLRGSTNQRVLYKGKDY